MAVSGVGTSGSGGSMNRGPELPSGHKKNLGKTLRKINKNVPTR